MDLRPEDCTLDLDDFARQLGSRVRLLAVTCASNAVGTDQQRARPLTHGWRDAGSACFSSMPFTTPRSAPSTFARGATISSPVPHTSSSVHTSAFCGDVRNLPRAVSRHTRIRPAPDSLPGRWMTGTQNHEGLAGVLAAINYPRCHQQRRNRSRARTGDAMEKSASYGNGPVAAPSSPAWRNGPRYSLSAISPARKDVARRT